MLINYLSPYRLRLNLKTIDKQSAAWEQFAKNTLHSLLENTLPRRTDWALIFIHKLNIQLSYCRGCLLSSLSVKRLLETDLIDHHVLLYSTVLITPSSDTTRWCDLIIHLIYAKSSLLSYIKYYDIWSRVLTSYQGIDYMI